LTKDSDLDDDTTWRYKLPALGKYTAFEMRINCDRFATRTDADLVYPLESEIKKVEMLAGGARALVSLTGQQLDAMNYWDFKRPNPRRYRQEADTGNDLILFLMGGRDLYDARYGWDMAKLGETYLEYTYDLSEGVAEHFKANDHDVSLYGYRWMGPGEPNFMGYFRSRQLAAWTTTAASALKTIPIPVGNPVRRIGVQAKTRAKTLGGTFSELEVRCNEGEYSPIIVKSMMDWCLAEASEYGMHNEVGGLDYIMANEISDLPRWWSYAESLHVNGYADAALLPYVWGLITLPMRILGAAGEAGEAVFSARGTGFQKCLRLGFDHDYDGMDLLQTGNLGALDLLVTEAAAAYEAAMFVQDIISY
jgi:hypothetical protein